MSYITIAFINANQGMSILGNSYYKQMYKINLIHVLDYEHKF